MNNSTFIIVLIRLSITASETYINVCANEPLSVSPCKNQAVGESWYDKTHHFDSVI